VSQHAQTSHYTTLHGNVIERRPAPLLASSPALWVSSISDVPIQGVDAYCPVAPTLPSMSDVRLGDERVRRRLARGSDGVHVHVHRLQTFRRDCERGETTPKQGRTHRHRRIHAPLGLLMLAIRTRSRAHPAPRRQRQRRRGRRRVVSSTPTSTGHRHRLLALHLLTLLLALLFHLELLERPTLFLERVPGDAGACTRRGDGELGK